MKLLLEIKVNRAAFFLEVLQNFSFVKATPITENGKSTKQEFRKAIEEVKLAKQGKLKTKSLNQLLDELPD